LLHFFDKIVWCSITFHRRSKHSQTMPMHPYSLRAFQWYQEHMWRGLGALCLRDFNISNNEKAFHDQGQQNSVVEFTTQICSLIGKEVIKVQALQNIICKKAHTQLGHLSMMLLWSQVLQSQQLSIMLFQLALLTVISQLYWSNITWPIMGAVTAASETVTPLTMTSVFLKWQHVLPEFLTWLNISPTLWTL